jgi:hypothetical protein
MRVRVRRAYSFHEAAVLLSVHVRTIQAWHKQGLPVIDEKSRPYLIMGADLRQFLRDRRQKQRRPLKPGEFFCPKCQQPQKSAFEAMEIVMTGRCLGRTSKQVLIKGSCEICHTSLTLFSSDRKFQQWQAEALAALCGA